MKQVIIRIDNEIEFLKLKEILEENNFSFMYNSIKDSAFPSLGSQKNDYFEVVFSKENLTDFLTLTENKYQYTEVEMKEIDSTKNGKKRSNKYFYYLLLYSVILTAFCVKQYLELNRNSKDKCFKYSWNFLNTEMEITDKKSKELRAIHFDNNYNYNFELIDTYTKGKLTSKSYDSDEDGNFEEIEYFNLNSKLCGYDLDTDKDGIFEFSTILLENNDTLYFYDLNNNCQIDSIKLKIK
jgi:hypothetical protein